MKRYDVLNNGEIYYCKDGSHVNATEAQADIDQLVEWIDHINLTMYDHMPWALLEKSEDIVRMYKGKQDEG